MRHDCEAEGTWWVWVGTMGLRLDLMVEVLDANERGRKLNL